MFVYIFASSLIFFFLMLSFFFFSKKDYFDQGLGSGFECGFSSYFFSRHSFCIHYFLICLIFLFFDLEICFVFLFFFSYFPTFYFFSFMVFFILALLFSLFLEWWDLSLEWCY